MSKKKVSGNTMTLKDFHGGSIPSDLPLPSAPGVVVRPTDRSAYDRPTAWGNPMGRADHRSRPHTSPATRHFDDKTPFLTHSVHIGRNFDEDERKPLDGGSMPRRTIGDDSIQVPLTLAEPKQAFVSAGVSSGVPSSVQARVQAPLSPRGAVSSYLERVSETSHVGGNSHSIGGNGGRGVDGACLNAWAMRKEMAGISEPVQSAWSGQSAVQKLAHASALDKVSSGRWQSKPSINYQTNIEVVRSPETESGLHSKGYGSDTYKRTDVMVERDAALARHAERGLQIDDGVQLPDHESSRAPINSELRDRKPTVYNNRVQPAPSDGKFGLAEFHPVASSEPVERPKLKLLPRTKPVEGLEATVIVNAQKYQWVTESVHIETVNEAYGNTNTPKPGSAGSDGGKQAVERPKLNLIPRSQPLEHLEVNAKRDRVVLFGGARPRELVLKERGVDDVVITNPDKAQHSDKVKHQVARPDRVPAPANPSRHSEKAENHPFDQRTGKKFERRDNRVDGERIDMQKKNWRNDSRRNSREPERLQQQSERPPSPETWRKPEQPKPSSPDAVGLQHGKAASALELAQAFSRSVSDPKLADRFSGHRGIPGRAQMPFSRLMGPTPRPQINGY